MRGVMLVAYAATACSIPEQKFDSLACASALDPTTAPAMVTITGRVRDPYTNLYIGSASIMAYDETGSDLLTTTASATGGFGLQLATGGVPLNGSLLVTAGTDYIPAVFFPGKPLTTDIQIEVELLAVNEVGMIGTAVGSAVGSDESVLFVAVLDCQGLPVANAQVYAVGATTYYLQDYHPDPTATGTDPDTGAALLLVGSDGSGSGSDSVAVTGSVSRTGDGSDQFPFHNHAVPVSPMTITETELVP
jgi:hypothetical protein